MFRDLVRLIWAALRGGLPWVLRFARLLFFLVITCLTSIFVGIPESVERIAQEWTAEAASLGLPLELHRVVRLGALVAASICLILGWLILASLTVFVLGLLLA